MKSLLIVTAILFLSACNTTPQTSAGTCASNAEEYRKNTEFAAINRTGSKSQRFDAQRVLDLNVSIKAESESAKCDTSNWPAQPDAVF
jgi:hypothetical protein